MKILNPYENEDYDKRRTRRLLGGLALTSVIYGAMYGATETYFLTQLAVPIAILMALVIWALPNGTGTSTKLMTWLFWAFLGALLCWPDYLALALPGMPWITATRAILIPLSIAFLISLSVSPIIRREISILARKNKYTMYALGAFVLISFLSVGWSTAPFMSLSKFIVAVMNWILILFIALLVFSKQGSASKFAFFLWLVAIFVCLIGVWERQLQAVPWADHIPYFLKIEDPSVERILSFKARAATGIYRVQSKFTTPLGLAEFLAYTAPFILHVMITSNKMWLRVSAALTLPLLWYTIVATDSRLGMVGMFMTLILYLLAWASLRWARVKDSIFGPLIVIAYPMLFVAFILATFFVGRLRGLIWGSGAEQFSTESRKIQIADGIIKVLERPWGYGFGRGADTLGFTNLEGVLTIDSYFLSIALELGLAGFIAFYGAFLIAIFRGASVTLKQKNYDASFIIPAMVSLINFVIIKSIFSQTENHPLVFAILGLLLASIHKLTPDSSSTTGANSIRSAGNPPQRSESRS